MNLFDARIPYFVVPTTINQLSGKIVYLAALDIYKRDSAQHLWDAQPDLTPYQRRKAKEVRDELTRRGLLSDALEILPISQDDRITLPRDCDYASLSFGELKTLVAAYGRARYSQEAFRFVVTQALLAKAANLSEQRLRDALDKLRQKRLIATEKLWKEGTRITLLDPELGSGCPIYHLGAFYREKFDTMPVWERYRWCLEDYDPRGQLKDILGPLQGYTVRCPFCRKPDPKGTLRFSAMEDTDRWTCFRCRRSGDSARLVAKLTWRPAKNDWADTLREVDDATAARLLAEQEAREPSEYDAVPDSIAGEIVTSPDDQEIAI